MGMSTPCRMGKLQDGFGRFDAFGGLPRCCGGLFEAQAPAEVFAEGAVTGLR